MTLFLIRHGETDLGAARVIQRADTPLSGRGLDQADRLARRLATLGVARVLSSDLLRAEMTARAIAREAGVALELEPLLEERNFGDLRGTPYAELEGDIFAPDSDPPGGESSEAFDRRVGRTWERIREVASRTPGNLAIVTHGLVCARLAATHLDAGDLEPPLHLNNTGLTLVEALPPWRIALWNCTRHLEDGGDGRQSAPA